MEAINLVELELGTEVIAFRLFCALIIGIVIGTEREFTHRPAGMRTHMLVALGSCSIMLVGQMIFVQYRPFGASIDPARLAAQVIAGVGFLGAGTILREGASVRGLTTAASVWTVACLGIAVGGGYYIVGLLGMVYMFITLVWFERLQKRIMKNRYVKGTCILESTTVTDSVQTVKDLAEQHQITISDVHIEHSTANYLITFTTECKGNQANVRTDDFQKALLAFERVVSLSK